MKSIYENKHVVKYENSDDDKVIFEKANSWQSRMHAIFIIMHAL